MFPLEKVLAVWSFLSSQSWSSIVHASDAAVNVVAMAAAVTENPHHPEKSLRVENGFGPMVVQVERVDHPNLTVGQVSPLPTDWVVMQTRRLLLLLPTYLVKIRGFVAQ